MTKFTRQMPPFLFLCSALAFDKPYYRLTTTHVHTVAPTLLTPPVRFAQNAKMHKMPVPTGDPRLSASSVRLWSISKPNSHDARGWSQGPELSALWTAAAPLEKHVWHCGAG